MDLPPEDRPPDLSWDDKLRALQFEAETLETPVDELVRQVFKRHALKAAINICQLADESMNDRIRLQASTYIVERNIGVLNAATPAGDAALDTFIERMLALND